MAFNLSSSDRSHGEPLQDEGSCRRCAWKCRHTAGKPLQMLDPFFQDWGEREELLHDLMRQNLRFLRGLGFKTLVMDGTSWTIGEAKVHYLVLSVLVGAVAVPIYWVQLEKIGASSQEERNAMFKAAFSLFDLKGMTLLADREYIGKSCIRSNHKRNHFKIVC